MTAVLYSASGALSCNYLIEGCRRPVWGACGIRRLWRPHMTVHSGEAAVDVRRIPRQPTRACGSEDARIEAKD